MTNTMLQLIYKDWRFNAKYMFGYLVLAVIGLVLFNANNGTAFYISVTLLITVLIIIGIHNVFACIINERKDHTFLFALSLPLSYLQYSTAKLVGNLAMFIAVWGLISSAILLSICLQSTMPNGLMAFAIVALLEVLTAYVLLLCVAMITEHEITTIIVMAIFNVCVSIFWFMLAKIDGIGSQMQAESMTWNSNLITAITIELLLVVLSLALTLFIQSKRRECY